MFNPPLLRNVGMYNVNSSSLFSLRIMCLCECALCCFNKDSCFCEVAHAIGHCCLCVIMPCMNAQGHHELRLSSNKGQLNAALLS
mmetsp:Transcript_25526/g.33233  ORF Transcript_25526/g.33233 Transcript_25526/m.33233 type:complete len:85 (-) Transcript_25526:534-788(-)